jgi:predicted nucleic acid-binding protein
MKFYPDTSFIGQLLVPDFASAKAVDCYRRLNRPALSYVALHELEVPNTLRARVFMAGGSAARAATRRESEKGQQRLRHLLQTGRLERIPVDWDDAVSDAEQLSRRFTEKLGVRALDLLHVAVAGLLHADVFITCDRRQARLAKHAGFSVELVGA